MEFDNACRIKGITFFNLLICQIESWNPTCNLLHDKNVGRYLQFDGLIYIYMREHTWRRVLETMSISGVLIVLETMGLARMPENP